MKVNIAEVFKAHRHHINKQKEIMEEFCERCLNQADHLKEQGEDDKAEGVVNALQEFLKLQ